MKKIALLLTSLVIILSLPALAAAKQVTLSNETGNPGDTVTVSIDVDNVSGIAGYNIDFTYDPTVLSADSAAVGADFQGYNFLPNLNTPGEVRLGMFSFSGNTNTDPGELATVTFTILNNAYKNSPLTFTQVYLSNEQSEEIPGTTSTNGSVTVTGVTVTVSLTPASVPDVVAGQAQTFTAEVLVNGSHLDLTSTDDVTFATSGNGSFGTPSLVNGNVQVDYTTHTLVETATITATENVTGNNNQDTSTVSSNPNGANAGQSEISAALNPANITADEAATATIQFKDQNGNPTTSLGGLTLAASGATLANAAWEVVDNGNGTATATYFPGAVGTENALQITLDGVQIGDNQTVTVTAGGASAVQSDISQPLSPGTITADESATATIQFKDQNGNPTTSLGGLTLAASGATLAGVTWEVADNGDGTATATYTPGAAGTEAALKITLGGDQVGIDQAVTVNPGVATAGQSEISAALSPASITADDTATATIQFKDQNGNETTNIGGADLAASGATLAGATWEVDDNGDGTATATYTPGAVGSETALKITLDGTQIGADQAVTVTAGVASAGQSEISAALDPPAITADQTATATIQFKDQNGNDTTSIGGLTLAASGATLAGATWEVADNGDGTATATYTPGAVGDETALKITLDGVQIGADQSVTVNPGVATAGQSEITAALSPATITADDTAEATIQFKDQKGNDTTNIGGAALAASGATLAGATWEVADNGDGTATATYTPGAVGSETALKITLDGVQIGADQAVTVTAGVAVSILLEGDPTKVASGGKSEAQLTATVQDQHGNTVTGYPETTITYEVTGPGVANAGWTNNTSATQDGIATIAFTTKGEVPDPGTTTVNIEATGGGFTSDSIVLTIVNFSAAAEFDALVTSGTPHMTTITAVGATNYTWTKVSGNGTLVATTSATSTFTAPDSITEGIAGHPTVIRVADAADNQVNFDLTITTYEPVRFTQPTEPVGITHDGDVKTYQLQVAGGDGNYTYQVSDSSSDVITVDANGLVTGKAIGTRTVYVIDGNGDFAAPDSFLSESFAIEVVDGIVVTPASKDLQASTTQQYAATGGKGEGTASNYTWSVDNATAGSIDANGLFTAQAVDSIQTANVRATDKTYTNIYAEATVTVYPTVGISDKPEETPTILPGEKLTLEAQGGSGNYEWSITDPDGNPGAWVEGESITFEAPDTGSFAGLYEITLRDKDNPDFTDTFQIKVPLVFEPETKNIKGGDSFNLVLKGADANATADYEFTEDASADTYTTLDPAPANFVEVANEPTTATTEVTADTVNELKKFKIKATVTGDDDLEAAGLNIASTGWIRVLPSVEFSGVIQEAQGGPAIAGATILFKLAGETMGSDTSDAEGNFSVDDLLTREMIGAEYQVVVLADGYLGAYTTTAGWVNPQTIELTPAADSVSGTVDDGTGPIEGARIESEVDGEPIVTYSDATGNYTLELPVLTDALAGELLARAIKEGYEASRQNVLVDPDFTLATQADPGDPQNVCEDGGSFFDAQCSVEIPADTLIGCHNLNIDPNIAVGEESLYTENSSVLVAIDLGGADLAQPIAICIPFDTAAVNPGDFKAGNAVIYHAPTTLDLQNGTNVEVVPTADIIYENHLGPPIEVCFYVTTLSTFGAGSSSGGAAGDGGGGGGGGCFIATAAGGPGGVMGLVVLILALLSSTGVMILRRLSKRQA